MGNRWESTRRTTEDHHRRPHTQFIQLPTQMSQSIHTEDESAVDDAARELEEVEHQRLERDAKESSLCSRADLVHMVRIMILLVLKSHMSYTENRHAHGAKKE
mmetsp:Transcript_9062/g.11566  ORF Transcript_9062/g.11566 Transcript_9062/m.11566 type:complete len:103 (+) Transcript_9062:1552-1860(+)